MKCWIARDGENNQMNVYELYLYFGQPTLNDDGVWASIDTAFELPSKTFPKIEPGECYSAEITLGEKV